MGTQFFLLVEGSVTVIKDGKEVANLQATAEKAPYFGEKAWPMHSSHLVCICK